MSVVQSDRIKSIEASYRRPMAAILTDLVHQHTYKDVCERLGGISRRTLIYWMNKYSVQGPGRGARSRTSECKNKVSLALTGRKRPQEVKDKIAKKLRGRKLSVITKTRISESLKRVHRERREE